MTMQTRIQSDRSTNEPPGSGVVDTARGEAAVIADRAKGETNRLVHEARQTLRNQTEEQAGRLASGAHDIANQLDALASGRGGTDGAVASFAHDAAERIDALAQRLDRDGIDGMSREVKQFARRRPGTYMLGAFAVGIAAGRLFRNADSAALAHAARPGSDDERAPAMSPTSRTPSTSIQEDPSWPNHPQY